MGFDKFTFTISTSSGPMVQTQLKALKVNTAEKNNGIHEMFQ